MGNALRAEVDEWTIEKLCLHLSELVAKESGNILGQTQQNMVKSRLLKRFTDLGGITPSEYYSFLQKNYDSEMKSLVGLLTTHHTFFFREFIHFEYLQKNFSKIVDRVQKRGDSKIRILSAACSRGQEVYSLAMFMEYLIKTTGAKVSYEIQGTDIDSESVKFASNGVYPYKEVITIPKMYMADFWQRGSGEISEFAKIKDSIKKNCKFDTVNLLEIGNSFKGTKFDIVFCRNVFIYFDNDTIRKICSEIKKNTAENGLFVTGISESLKTIDDTVHALDTCVYTFDPIIPEQVSPSVNTSEPTASTEASVSNSGPIRMLCVDDSKSILKLLKKIFESDPGFELVGTAENGVEAQEFLKNNKVDAMTLDIHMPEMDGVEYLKKNFGVNHPKVIVVSSASREDTNYAQKTLSYGASDFIEKPALNNINERADEIKVKIKTALLSDTTAKDDIGKEFKSDFKIMNSDKKARLYFASFSDSEKIKKLAKAHGSSGPPIILFTEGNGNFLGIFEEKLASAGISKIVCFEPGTKIEKNIFYICDLKEHFPEVHSQLNGFKTSVSVLGASSSKAVECILELKDTFLMLEDSPALSKEIREIASDVFPWTSFAHMSDEYLAKD